jgi:hypothetical protein
MKTLYHYLTILFLLILSLNVSAGGKISGPSSICPDANGHLKGRYEYDDENNYCSTIEWKVYENGVEKTTGFTIGPGYIDVTWSASGNGKVEARGYDLFYFDGKLYECGEKQDWKRVSTTLLDGTPDVSGPLTFCNSGDYNTRIWTVSPTCPTSSYTWEAPAGWSLNGGGNTLTTTNTSVKITAPSTGSGAFNIRVRAKLTNGYISPWRNREAHLGPPTGGMIERVGGGTLLCPDQSYYLVATTDSEGDTFSNWTFSGNLSGYGSGSTANITTYSNYNGAQITVTATNICNKSVEISQTFGLDYNCGYSLTAEEVNVYPNPSSNSDITVEWPELAHVSSVQLVDENAKIIDVLVPKGNKAKFKVDKLPKGNYSIQVHVGKGVIKKGITKRIIIE